MLRYLSIYVLSRFFPYEGCQVLGSCSESSTSFLLSTLQANEVSSTIAAMRPPAPCPRSRPADNPLYTTSLAEMTRFLQEDENSAAVNSTSSHSSHTVRKELSGNGIKRGGNEEPMEEVLDDDIEKIIAEDLAAFETEEKEQEVDLAEKTWGEEKARRRKGLLGVPAADARIGGNYTYEERVRTRIEEELRKPRDEADLAKSRNRKRKAADIEEEDDANRQWLDNNGKDTTLLVDGKQEWEVEAIIDAKLMKHKTRKLEPKDVCYKVTYKGNWPKWNAKPQWQCKEDLVHCAELVRNFHRNNPKKPGAHRAYSFRPEATIIRKEQQPVGEREVAMETEAWREKRAVGEPFIRNEEKMDDFVEAETSREERAMSETSSQDGDEDEGEKDDFIANLLPIDDFVQDLLRINIEDPEHESEIIVISSDESSSSPSQPVKPTRKPGRQKKGEAPPRAQPAKTRNAPLNITLSSAGAPLQALGPMGLLGRTSGNGPIAQFRRMLDEFDPDDSPEPQKVNMDDVERTLRNRKRPKRMERSYKRARVETGGEGAFEEVLEGVGDVGGIDFDGMEF